MTGCHLTRCADAPPHPSPFAFQIRTEGNRPPRPDVTPWSSSFLSKNQACLASKEFRSVVAATRGRGVDLPFKQAFPRGCAEHRSGAIYSGPVGWHLLDDRLLLISVAWRIQGAVVFTGNDFAYLASIGLQNWWRWVKYIDQVVGSFWALLNRR